MLAAAGADSSPREDGCSFWAWVTWTPQRSTGERSSVAPHSRVLQEGELFEVW